MTDKTSDYPRHTVRLPGEYTAKLEALQSRYQCNKSVIVRMGIDALIAAQSTVTDSSVQFRGDEETVDRKWVVVKALLDGKGICMAAREAQTTRKTVNQWLAEDPMFREFAQDAKDESVELVEHVVWHKAAEEKNLNACYGLLNAKHAAFGMVKAGYVEAKIKKFLAEKVVPLVERYIPRDQLGKFTGDLRQLTP